MLRIGLYTNEVIYTMSNIFERFYLDNAKIVDALNEFYKNDGKSDTLEIDTSPVKGTLVLDKMYVKDAIDYLRENHGIFYTPNMTLDVKENVSYNEYKFKRRVKDTVEAISLKEKPLLNPPKKNEVCSYPSAIDCMLHGYKASRKEWGSTKVFVFHVKDSLYNIFENGKTVAYCPPIEDIQANDWIVFE